MRKYLRGGVGALFIGLMVALTTGVGVIVSAAPVSAQTFSVSRIDIRGNQRIEDATIRNFLGLDLSGPVTGGQINAAYQRLAATGLFEEIAMTPSGSTLVVTVREYPTINRINFERNKKLKDEKLAEIITSRPRHTYSPAQAEADAALIVEAYRQAGRYTAEVKPKIIRRADNRVDLVFEVFEGKVVEVERISFVGNRNFSDRRLRSVLATKQAGILRGLVQSDTFIADRVAFDRQVLADFYASRGYIDFQVLSVATEVVRERNGFFLTFTVQEGQSYKFGTIKATSDLSEIDPDDFLKIVRLKSGATYSPFLVDQTVERIEDYAVLKGMNFIRVTPRVTRNDADLTLDLELVIDRGPRVYVERIDIEGNTTTLDRVIRREFEAVEGDPFNPRQIRRSANRIRALGFFSTVDVTPREGSSPDRVILDVDVEDKPTGSLSLGVSYGASSGVGAVASLSESNFLGRGQLLRFRIGTASNNQDAELTFAEPKFLGRNLRLELSLTQTAATQQNIGFDVVRRGFQPSIQFPLSERGSLNLFFNRSNSTVQNVTSATPALVLPVGTRRSTVLGLTYTYDSRNSGLDPNSGVILRLNTSFAGLGGQTNFAKTSFLVGAQTRIFNEEVVLRAELEGGVLSDRSGQSWFPDRFTQNSAVMRGFATNGMGPRYLNTSGNDALGGNMFAVARFEASFPIGLPEEYGIAGGLFFDIGSIWNLDGTTTTGGTDASMHIRSVVGVSLFWDTPVGPLRFNLSRPIVQQSYDVPETFSLSVGTRF
jgi:outer membrane protein insertion porin family